MDFFGRHYQGIMNAREVDTGTGIDLYRILSRVINAERIIISTLDSVSHRLESVSHRLDGLDTTIDDFRSRLESIESSVARAAPPTLQSTSRGVIADTEDYENRFDAIVDRIIAEELARDEPRSYFADVLINSSLRFVDHATVAEPDDSVCSICLCSLSGMVRTMRTCNHRFHSSCIEQWAARHSTCPLCRCSFEREGLPG